MPTFFKRVGVALYTQHIAWLKAEVKRLRKEEKRHITTSEIIRRLIEKEPTYIK